MPVRITWTARDQYRRLFSHYLSATTRRLARPAAARKLMEAYRRAVDLIEAGPKAFLTHPRPYPDLAGYGFRWIKVHRYWFGYVPGDDPVIANILDETSDIPRHVSLDLTPMDVA